MVSPMGGPEDSSEGDRPRPANCRSGPARMVAVTQSADRAARMRRSARSRRRARRYAAHGRPMSSREPAHPEELLLLDYVIGQLPAETRDQIKRHVAACRACSRTIDDLILTVDELDRLPTMAIPHDSPAELAAARARPASRSATSCRRSAIVLFALLALVTFGGSRGADQAAADADRSASTRPRRCRARCRSCCRLESAQLVFVQGRSGDYVVLAPQRADPVDRRRPAGGECGAARAPRRSTSSRPARTTSATPSPADQAR